MIYLFISSEKKGGRDLEGDHPFSGSLCTWLKLGNRNSLLAFHGTGSSTWVSSVAFPGTIRESWIRRIGLILELALRYYGMLASEFAA